ncbi:hypothetical protein ACAG39_09840 [Caldicellulosiruptoraceae bacterium PP1]
MEERLIVQLNTKINNSINKCINLINLNELKRVCSENGREKNLDLTTLIEKLKTDLNENYNK